MTTVTIPKDLNLTPRQSQIITYIIDNPECSAYDISQALGIGEHTARKHLRKIKKDIIPKMNVNFLAIPARICFGRPNILYSIKHISTKLVPYYKEVR